MATNYIAPWLLMVSARAAATHTSPNLFDCLPGELFQLVRDDPVPATDAEQKALVDQRLKEESAAAKKIESKVTFPIPTAIMP